MMPLLTYQDMIDRLVAWLEGKNVPANQTKIRSAIMDAYSDLAAAHQWSFLQRMGRIFVNAEVSLTGAYDHTGGTYEKQLTISTSGFDWDTYNWAKYGSVYINNVVCDISAIKSATVATLDSQLNPGADVASGTVTLFQRYHLLPSDFMRFTGPFTENSWQWGQECSLTEILAEQRYNHSSGRMQKYAIADMPDAYDQKVIYVWPHASTAETVDFMYFRRMRDLLYTGWDSRDFAGTVAVTAGQATVTGTSTEYESGMVGSVWRIGSSATERPTGRFGTNPYKEERSIAAVASATSITLDANIATMRSGVKAVVSDPIDMNRPAYTAFYRMAQCYLAEMCGLDTREGFSMRHLEKRRDEALLSAMGADPAITAYDYVTDGRLLTPVPDIDDGLTSLG